MLIPIICAAAIGICGLYVGVSLSAALTKEQNAAEALLDLIGEIKNGVKHYRAPLPAIFTGYKDDRLGADFLRRLRSGGLSEAIEGELAVKGALKGLPSSTVTTLRSFAAKLGDAPSEQTVAACDCASETLKVHLAKTKEAYPKRKKMYVAISVAASLALAIIII